MDANAAHLESVARDFGIPTFSSVGDLLTQAKPAAVSVAVPTVAHLEVAQELLEEAVDILIEKPLVRNLPEADALIKLANQNNRIAQVGRLERFNPAVQATVR